MVKYCVAAGVAEANPTVAEVISVRASIANFFIFVPRFLNLKNTGPIVAQNHEKYHSIFARLSLTITRKVTRTKKWQKEIESSILPNRESH